MTLVAACNNCGAIAGVRCVDDHCCEREDRDAAFLTTVGQSWQSEANRLLDAWAETQAEIIRLRKIDNEHRIALETANLRRDEAQQAFDKFMYGCMKIRADVASDV